jgi:hypothetical protein
MVRLQIGGIWIDMNEFDFELKWKHPIQNNLKGESSTYSTDMTVPLTTNNKTAFDYKIFLESGKTNKYLYGQLIVNGSTMPVRCYIQNFSSNGIKFYLEQFRQSAVGVFLKDTTTLDNLFLPQIQAGTETDISVDIAYGSRAGTLPDLFLKRDAWTPRINVQAHLLLQELAIFYGLTLDNAPTNYDVFCNQWKARTGIFDSAVFEPDTIVANTWSLLPFNDTAYTDFIYIDGLSKIISPIDFRVTVVFKIDITNTLGQTTWNLSFRIRNVDTAVSSVLYSEAITPITGSSVAYPILDSGLLAPGRYVLECLSNCAVNVDSTWLDGDYHLGLYANYTALELATEGFDEYYQIPDDGAFINSWQNLPKITAKSLFETIAVCAGKMIEYAEDGTTIKFVNFEDVFSPSNAIDVSDKLVEWKTKEFKFLTSNNATVNYADGRVIATVIVADETLPTATNSVATIDAIRIQDEALSADRNTTDLVLNERIDTHFEVIEKLPLLYAPLTTPRLFEAEFMYFADNKRPLLVRQLGGIFIALESIISTKNTITLKLLKIA